MAFGGCRFKGQRERAFRPAIFPVAANEKNSTRQCGAVIRCIVALTAFLATSAGFGCSVRQPVITPQAAGAPAKPLPFKGRLIDGDRGELPPAVALSLSDNSAVTFSYREELTHDERHVPLIISALDPVTYIGSPLGDYSVTAFASLSIVDGDQILGDYTAKVHVSKSYNLYSEPTHRELDRNARAAVRQKIDEELDRDANRLAEAIARARKSPIGQAGQ